MLGPAFAWTQRRVRTDVERLVAGTAATIIHRFRLNERFGDDHGPVIRRRRSLYGQNGAYLR